MKGNITNVFFRDTKSPQRRWFWFGVITLCVLVILCLLLRQCSDTTVSPADATEPTVATEVSGQQLPTINFGDNDGYQEPSQSPGVIIGATSGYIMQAHSRYQEIEFSNNPKNRCALKILLYLADGTLLFESDYLLPGDTVSGITLARELEEGTYRNVTLLYQMYSESTPHTAISQCEFPIEIKSL